MKLGRTFKAVLFWCSGLLYATGLAAWALASRYFQVDQGYGPEPSPLKPRFLHAHSVLGLAFLGVFGYLWHAHVEPGLKHKRKKQSGLALVIPSFVLFLTVPFLFYADNETARSAASFVHVWLGAILLAPFLFHLRSKKPLVERRRN
jgi:hypothetical protein